MVDLLPHQREAAEKLSNGKILWGGVGVGKSLTVLAYYVAKQAPKDIYVITTAKKRDSLDWEGEAVKFGISTKRELSRYGTLYVDSWNNIHKYIGVEDAFFIFDEQRLVGSGLWAKCFQKIAKLNDWVMLTATPGDTWLDYIPVFVANNLYRNATEFKREHVVYAPFSRFPKVVRYLNVSTLEKYRNMLLVEMPYLKHTIRDLEFLECEYDHGKFDLALKSRWHPYELRPIKDVAELFRVLRRVVNTDPDRMVKLRMLMERHPKLIVFYNFDYELEILRELKDEIPLAEWNGHRKQPIPQTDRWIYLVQYVAGAEGWNCTTTDAMVFYSLTYSYKNFEQAQGRIDRLNTLFTNLKYNVLWSNSMIDRALRKSLEHKELFSERKYAEKWHLFDD